MPRKSVRHIINSFVCPGGRPHVGGSQRGLDLRDVGEYIEFRYRIEVPNVDERHPTRFTKPETLKLKRGLAPSLHLYRHDSRCRPRALWQPKGQEVNSSV